MTERKTVFLTGATGSMGLAATEALLNAGHRVVGVARSDTGAATLRGLGAEPVKVDLLDAAAVARAMRGADAVAHFATSIPTGFSAVKPGAWKTNDRLRRNGTRALIAAAKQNGVRRFIFESIALAYPDHGDEWIDETVDLRVLAPPVKTAIEAEAMLADFGRNGGEPVSLRYSRIYGPGRASQSFLEALQKRQLPIIGPGLNYVSSIHIDDVGTSVVAALSAAPGVYNVSDDEPMLQRDLMEFAARTLGAPAPRHMPYPIARVLMGKLVNLLTASQRVSSLRLQEETGWRPRFTSALQGWPDVLRRELSTTGALLEAAG